VTYNPTIGTPRTITAVVRQAREADLDDVGDEQLTDKLWVLCDRDATTGINEPQLGDLLTRSVTDDPDRRPYVFTGQKEDITASDWVLIFARTTNTGRSPTG